MLRFLSRRTCRSNFPRLYARRILILRLVLAYFLLFLPIVWLVLSTSLNSSGSTLPSQLDAAERVLVVVAHPDDESLFFSPTILHLTSRPAPKKTGLLVLSQGESLWRNRGEN